MANPLPIFHWGTAAPTSTSEYHQVGEIIINSDPAIGETWAWVCTTAGYPGTWKKVVLVDGFTQATITAAGSVSVGTRQVVMTAADNITLAAAASHVAGFEVIVLHKSGGGTATVVAASGNTLTGTATAADGVALRWMSNGSTHWLRGN